MNNYLHQASPTAPVEQFSDKPVRVDGVKYTPRWPWSDAYRKQFRAGHAKARQGYLGAGGYRSLVALYVAAGRRPSLASVGPEILADFDRRLATVKQAA